VANKRAQGTIFVDTTGDLSTPIGLHLIGVQLTATSANATLELTETNGAGTVKWHQAVKDSGESRYISLSDEPIRFNVTIFATITNGKAILIVRDRPPSDSISS